MNWPNELVDWNQGREPGPELDCVATVTSVASWLMKSEPDVFGYDDLERVKREGWDGVRNYQARNFMRAMKLGDRVLFYHSNAKPPGAAGIAEIVGEAEPDPTQFDPASKYYDPKSNPDEPRWDWVTVGPVRRLHFVPIDEIRTIPEMADSALVAKGNRLSVMPLTDEQFDAVVARADELADDAAAADATAQNDKRR